MKIGLIDVDGHNFPNYALMKISAYFKEKGNSVEWANMENYDRTYISKVFTFSPDFNNNFSDYGEVFMGGTGYDIKSKLQPEIENSTLMDYSIYPQYNFSIQFFSRGCIRHCPFCLVNEKEGNIKPATPSQLNPKGEWIEVLDNNFFANPEWKSSVDYLLKQNQRVNLHGVDIRIMNEEQAFYLNKLKLKQNIKIAWDLPELDLTNKLKEVVKYIKPYKIMCYVLIGFNSTIEQDLFRITRLKELGIVPFIMPFRDYGSRKEPSQYEKDIARWANNKFLFKSCDFKEFIPRKGFKCNAYFGV